MILNFQDLADSVQSMTKMRQENGVTDCSGMPSVENEIELW